jgi:hypothetical protein
LAFSFLALLSAFHAIAGFGNILTQAQARAIDYVYLGVAAIGIFVLALNYEGKRQDYEFSEQTDKLKNALLLANGEVGNFLSRNDTTVCGTSTIEKPPFPVHCDLIEKLDWGEATTGVVEDKSKITLTEFLDRFPPAPAGLEEAFARAQRNLPLLKDARKKAMEASMDLEFHKDRAKANRDVREENHGLFTWPFIIAFAFALRLTRTTIEVFDWTRRPSPAA